MSKEVFPSISPVGHWGPEAAEEVGKLLTVLLSRAEKVALMVSLEHGLGDRIAGFEAPPRSFSLSFCHLLSII